MNDTQELVWGRRLVNDVLVAHPIEFSLSYRLFVSAALQEPDQHVLPLVGSFSKNGDLLSQWRAYSDDAKGFSIEFDGQILANSLPVNMKDVLYDQEEQETLILQSLRKFHFYWQRGGRAGRLAVAEVLPEFAIDLITLKHPTFFEEQEVRMVHLVTRLDDWWVDPGGHDQEDRKFPGVSVKMRERSGLQIPYIALPLHDPNAITAVVLGPKNPESLEEVRERLLLQGLYNVTVRRSAVPYR